MLCFSPREITHLKRGKLIVWCPVTVFQPAKGLLTYNPILVNLNPARNLYPQNQSLIYVRPAQRGFRHCDCHLYAYLQEAAVSVEMRHCSWKVKITQTVRLGPFWKILWTENFIVIHTAMSFCQPYLQKYPESIRFSPSSLSSNPSYQNFWYKGCNKERNTGLPQWPPYWSPCSHTCLHTAITMIG